MKKKLGLYLSLLTIIITFFVSCGNRYIIHVSDMQPRLQYTGFSIARPADTGWILSIKEQDYGTAMFRKYLEKYPGDMRHTAYVSVNLCKMQRPAASLEEFVNIDKETHRVSDTLRFKLINITQTPDTLQGQWCVYWTEELLDRKPAINPSLPLTLRNYGFTCLHPAFKEIVLEARVSERAPEGEFDPLTFEEGKQMLKSIILESAPGVPVK